MRPACTECVETRYTCILLYIHAGSYEIPISCLVAPSEGRCLREPDRVFVNSLKKEMMENPTSLVSPIIGLVRLGTNETYDSRHPQGYIYETIGGNNSRIALQELVKEHPDMDCFKTRLVAVYIGLSDDEALWVAAKHNRASSFTHSTTTQDKVCFINFYMFIAMSLSVLYLIGFYL